MNKFIILTLFILTLVFDSDAEALAAGTVRWSGATSSAWETASNWTTVSGTPSLPPAAGDAVEIGTGAITNQPTITTPTTIASLTYGNSASSTLTINGNLAISGDITNTISGTAREHDINLASGVTLSCVNANLSPDKRNSHMTITFNGGTFSCSGNFTAQPTAVADITLTVGTGTFTVGGTTLQGAATNQQRNCVITVSTGTLTFSGDYTKDGGSSDLTSSGAATISFDGDITNTRGTFDLSNATTTLAATTNITPTNDMTFGSLVISGTVTANSGTLTIAENLSVNGTGTLNLGGVTPTVTGTTTIDGAINITSTSGTKTFGDIIINDGGAMNFSATAGVTMNGNLQIDGTGSITGTQGTWTFQKSGGGGTLSGTAASKSLTAATFTTSYSVNSDFSIPTITVTAGATLTNNATLTVETALSSSGGGSTGKELIQGSDAVLNIGGASDIATLTATVDANTVNYTSTTASQTVKGTTYHHLTINKSGQITTLGADTTVNGTLTITAGTLNTSTRALTANGVTNISGTLGIDGGLNAKLFVGLVTVNSGGTWDNSADYAVTFRGGITHNGTTFTAGTGVQTFDTNSQAIGGTTTISIPKVTVTGVTLTNNTSLTISTALSGSGGLTQGSNAVLNIGGTSGITTLTASATGNVVNYNGTAAQTIHTGTYVTLKANNTAGGTLGGNVTLNTLTIGDVTSNSVFSDGGFVITPSGASVLNLTSGTVKLGSATVGTAFPSFNTLNIASGTTIEYASGTTQTVSGTPSYQNLTISGAGTKTPDASLTIAGNLTVNASGGTFNLGAALNHTVTGNVVLTAGTLNGGSSTLTLYGNWTGSGTFTANTGTVVFTGTNAQTIGSATTTFNNLTINKASNTASFGANITINGDLTITSGTLDIGGVTSTVTGATSVSGTINITATFGTKTFGDIIINDGGVMNFTVTEDVAMNGNLQINGTGSITGTQGTWTFQKSGGGGTLSGTADSKSLTAATFTTDYSVNSDFSIPTITVASGATLTNNATLTVETALSSSGGGSGRELTQGNGAVLNIGGSSTINTLTATVDANTVNYTSTTASQTVKGTTYHHLTIDKSGQTAALGADTTVNGTLTITAGTLNTGANTLAANGITSITGTLGITGKPGTKTFTGMVTINSGGVWNNSSNEDVTFQGGITHNGTTFTAGTGVQTFDTNDQAIGGTTAISIPSMTVTGITLTNNTTLTVDTDLSGTGGLTQGSSDVLNIGGTSDITTLTATVNPNTVSYTSTAAAQTVKGTTYHHLTIDKSGRTATLGAATVVNGDLTITAGTLNTSTSNYALTLNGSFVNNATFTANGSDITIGGTSATPNIAGFSTTGALSFERTASTTTLTGSVTAASLTMNGSGGTLNLGSGLSHTINGNVTLTAGTLDGNSSTLSLTGNWTGSATFTAGTGSVNFSGSGAQTITNNATTFNNLTKSGAGTGTLGAAIIVNGTLNITGGTFSTSANNYALTLNGSFTNSATFTANGSNITIGGTSATPSIAGFSTTGALSFERTASTATLTGSVTAASLTINGSGGTLNLGSGLSHTINGNITLTAGTLDGNSSAISLTGNWTNNSAFTAGTGTITFNGTSGQTISGTSITTFNNLTISNTTVTTQATTDITVNAALTLTGDLAMGSNTLTMGGQATTSGTGDVTGIVKRTTISHNIAYSFGNKFTTIIFPLVGTLPTEMSVKITLGSAPSWKTTAVTRYYDIIQTGGSGSIATVKFHYRDSELNGNTESNMTVWHYHASDEVVLEHGRLNSSTTDNWIELSNIGISAFSSDFGDFEWTLANMETTSIVWDGNTDTDWTNLLNWTGGIPGATDDVIIPDPPAGRYSPTLPSATTINSLTIQSGGILNGTSSAQLTIDGGGGCWINEGTFNPDTSTVIFTNAAASMSGETNFYNVTIDTGAELTMSTNNIMLIAGTITNNGTWRARFLVNTVEYNGGNQTALNPNGGTGGYQYLILSGSGTKTMPASALTIAGDFSMSGMASATAGAAMTISGNFTIGAGTSFDAGSYEHSIGGDFTNNGDFTASTSTMILNGTAAQTIGGTTTAFNNLTISNTGAAVSVNTSFSIGGTLDVDPNAVLSPDASVVISGSGALTGNGTVKVTRTATTPDFNAQYTISNKTLTDLTVEYAGTATQEASALTYGNLKVNNASGVTLGGSATVNGTLTVSGGILTTGSGNTLTLGSSGTLAESNDADGNTSNDNVVVGNIQTTRTLSTGINETFGGLGVQINAAGSAPGSTVVLRKTGTGTAQTIDGMVGIKRTFVITPTSNTGLDATLVTKYADSELSGINEAGLIYARSTDGGTTWPNRYVPSRDTGANTLSLTGVDAFSLWTAGPFASKYIVSSDDNSPVAGGSVTITAQLADANDNAISTEGRVVTWSSTNGGSFSSDTSVTNAGGIATVTFTTSTAAGTVHTVTGTDADNLTGTSSSITTIAGAATKVVFVQQPSDAAAGNTISPTITVQLQDVNGNNVAASGVDITISLSSGTGELNGTTLQTTNASGLATFHDLSIDIAGSKNLTVSSDGLTSAVSDAFTISAGAAAKLVFIQQPSDTTAGETILPVITVRLQDTYGNNVSTGGVSVTMTLSSGTGVLSGTTVKTTQASGLATFNDLSINLVGTKNLTASSSGLTSAESDDFTILAGTATKVGVETEPDGSGEIVPAQSIIPGSLITVYAITRDASDNFVANVAADTWSLENITGGVISSDIASSGDRKSAVFTGHFAGTAEIKATSGSLSAINSGTVTVTAGVSFTSPAYGDDNVSVNKSIAAVFSEAMDDSTVDTATFTVSDSGGNISGTVSYNDRTAEFTPSGVLDSDTAYTAVITTGIKDLTGNNMASAYMWSFTTGTSTDVTTPVVSATTPASGATGVAYNGAIAATCSEVVSASTITEATFILSDGVGNIDGTVTSAGATATFTPMTDLAINTTYTATITTGVKDLAGNGMASDYTWSFTTGSSADNSAPAVSSTNPANGDTGVVLNGAITAVFGETMSASTLTIATFTMASGSSTVTGSVSYYGSIATFTPLANLSSNTTYTATITTGGEDLAGNAMSSAYTWSFTTGTATDTTPPTVNSTNPSNGATGVAINTAITAAFSETMDISTITTASFTVSDNSGSISGAVTCDGTTALFTPLNNLSYSTVYTATITTGVKDLAGNAMASSFTWSFTTESAPEPPPPPPAVTLSIDSTKPLNGATSVAVDTAVSATFSMYINGSTATNDTFILSDGVNEVAGSVTTNGATATFTPLVNLAYSTAYTATITTGVRAANWAGTSLNSNYSWSFTTESAPPQTPTPTQTLTPTSMPSPTPSPELPFTPTPIFVTTPIPPAAGTPTPAIPKETPTPSFVASPVFSPTATPPATETPTPTIPAETPTPTPTPTPTSSPAPTPGSAVSMSLSKDVAYLSGDTVVITATDSDRNADSVSEDVLTTAIKVFGVNYYSGKDLLLDLNEDGADSGVFLATIKTGTATSGGASSNVRSSIGVIKTVQDGTATVRYTGKALTEATISRELTFSSFDATLSFNADIYTIGDYAKMMLADAERNTRHTEAEVLLNDVFIETSPFNITRARMVETGTDTGAFGGTIQVVDSGGTLEYERIQAAAGETLTITYFDGINTTGYPRVVTDTAFVAAVTPSPTAIATPTIAPTPTPTPAPTPSPTATPAPVACIAASVAAYPEKLEIVKNESAEIIVTVTGEDGCVADDVNVKTKVSQNNLEKIKITPSEQKTDANGQVIFTIKAKKGKGKAKIKFKAKGVNKKAKVIVYLTK